MFPGEPGDNKGQVYEKKQRPLVYSPESIARMGMVYEGMPEDKLIEAGYTPGLLIQRRKENNAEFLTYTEYSTEEQGDTVTFVVRDGVVKSWFTEPAGDN